MFKISRRKVQIVLGLIWLLDGCLQFQPKMFSSKFISLVVSPAVNGQPFYVWDPVHWASVVFLTHPAVFNSLIAVTQISIGLLILNKRTVKYGILMSVVWGLFVWFMGESFDGMLSGHASLLTGLPGAALLYSVLSWGVRPKADDQKQVADYWLVFFWSAIWLAGAIFELLPAQNSINSLKSMITMNISGAPGWLASVDKAVAGSLNHLGATSSSMHMPGMSMSGGNGYLFIVFLAGIMLLIGVGVLINKTTRIIAVVAGSLLAILFWLVGQSLGGYYTGVMTDVQTAPLLILLGLSIIGQPFLSGRLKMAYRKVEKALT